MTTDSLLQRRFRPLGRNSPLFYDKPLHLVRGDGVWVYDADGKRYLDAYNNVPHVGHCHPRVVAAASLQLAQVNTNTRYLHPNISLLAAKLSSKFQKPLEVCFFVNSGSEANDLALRIARVTTGRKDVLCFENAYH